MVHTFNHYLDGTLNDQDERAEQESWDLIFKAAGKGNDRFIAKWKPSHLDDCKTAREKKANDGLVADEDIVGNAQAGVLAKEGTSLRPQPTRGKCP